MLVCVGVHVGSRTKGIPEADRWKYVKFLSRINKVRATRFRAQAPVGVLVDLVVTHISHKGVSKLDRLDPESLARMGTGLGAFVKRPNQERGSSLLWDAGATQGPRVWGLGLRVSTPFCSYLLASKKS